MNGEVRPRRNTVVWASIIALVVLAIAVAVVLVASGEGDDEKGSSTGTSQAKRAPTSTPSLDTSTAVWPLETSTIRYSDPVTAARGFAVDYVGFQDPVVGEFRAGDSRSGEVPVQARAGGPETTVLVRQLGADGTWWVLGSQTANIQSSAPDALATISSPVTVRGTSTAFEGTVNVEVREDGNTQPLAQTFVMGGANGQMAPYEQSIAFRQPERAPAGAVLLFTISPEDGRTSEATVVRIRFAAT